MPPMNEARPTLKTGSSHGAEPSNDSRVSRRGFLGSLTASVALAGTEGCRRAVEKIVPYQSVPEQVIPGVPNHFATVYARRGDALGLVVESHEGRPTKIEGNPLHPSSLGAADLIAQASILDLYDPERSTSPMRTATKSSWDAFTGELQPRLAELSKTGGKGLRILAPPTNSPTVLRMRETFAQRFPNATLHRYSPIDASNSHAGMRLALGKPVQPVVQFDRAKVVLALDSDFLQTEPGNVRAHKLFSEGRKVSAAKNSMSRLYVVEPGWTVTGVTADHRLRLPASRVTAYALALVAELVRQGLSLGDVGKAAVAASKSSGSGGFPAKWIEAVARDLIRGGVGSVWLVGSGQPPIVHALAAAIHRALGSEGPLVTYAALTDPRGDRATDLPELARAVDAGEVTTLIILGGNPVYDAPADLKIADKIAKVAFTAHLSPWLDETSARCMWHLPMAHELESWSDQRSLDGSLAVQQPLIAPLHDGRDELALWAALTGQENAHSYDLVRTTFQGPLLAASGLVACEEPKDGRIGCTNAHGDRELYPVLAYEHDWKKVLRDGVLRPTKPAGSESAPALPLDAGALAAALNKLAPPTPPTAKSLEVVFVVDPKMLDGRHANNTWLQELPDPVTKIAWDNAALVSPATARELGVENGDVLRLSRGAQSIEIAAWVVPGTADATLILPLGWGRTKAGRIGTGRGFDVYPLRTTEAMHIATGVSAERTGRHYDFAQTQTADSMEGRPLIRMAKFDEYQARPHFAELATAQKRSLPLWADVDYSKGHQWGMSIDLNACTGCSACVVACQAENNIPVVGKEQVALGRDMQWLRIDRYFEVEAEETRALVQPMACVQCEEAPCENVCPVAAVQHSPEGLSEVAYNRCVGTRFCANNCPYKVRRFNFLNWHNDGVWAETGGLPETLQMQQNPNVSVRFRGVIEKCSYCVQRIQSKKLSSKRDGRDLRDGEIVTACQQTCPADAIVFGDLNDVGSRVSKLATGDRRYGVLEELGTRPRTTYLAKIHNANPEMA